MNDPLKIQTTYIPYIRSQLKSGSMVLFTGAGFSMDGINFNGDKIPSVKILTKLIWDICYPGEEIEEYVELQDMFEDANLRHTKKLKQLLGSPLHSCFTFSRFENMFS